MKTEKNIILFLATVVFTLVCTESIEAALNWNWDSGTTEGWTDAGGTVVSIETGRNGTFGLGARQSGVANTTVQIGGQSFDPGILVGGQFGTSLTMTGEIYVDINREIAGTHGNLVDLLIYGNNSFARFVTYPFDGFGSIEGLGDGWFRHHLANVFHFSSGGELAGIIRLTWDWDDNAIENPVVYDNLTIIPEPATLSLLGLGAAAMLRRRRRSS